MSSYLGNQVDLHCNHCRGSRGELSYSTSQGMSDKWVKAVDQKHVEVLIPDTYKDDPVRLISLLESQVPVSVTQIGKSCDQRKRWHRCDPGASKLHPV